jgi:hypothetical protein
MRGAVGNIENVPPVVRPFGRMIPYGIEQSPPQLISKMISGFDC